MGDGQKYHPSLKKGSQNRPAYLHVHWSIWGIAPMTNMYPYFKGTTRIHLYAMFHVMALNAGDNLFRGRLSILHRRAGVLGLRVPGQNVPCI